MIEICPRYAPDLTEISPAPRGRGRRPAGPGSEIHNRDSAEIVRDRDQPRPAEIVRDQPKSAEIQPRFSRDSAEVSRDQPRSSPRRRLGCIPAASRGISDTSRRHLGCGWSWIVARRPSPHLSRCRRDLAEISRDLASATPRRHLGGSPGDLPAISRRSPGDLPAISRPSPGHLSAISRLPPTTLPPPAPPPAIARPRPRQCPSPCCQPPAHEQVVFKLISFLN